MPERPHLDGRLDEPLWSEAEAAELRPRDGEATAPRTTVRLACDGQFLFLAIRAQRAEPASSDPLPSPRPRDADLTARDHVDVLLDLDRDYATYYRFTVDSRGWTAESCWGDPSWNPTWYVARGGDEQYWTIEAAIPLDELTPTPPGSAVVWAVGLQRVIPEVGFQSFSGPASPEIVPEGFGYLLFP